MFCMNCGQELPDGAKFCLKCGTLQGTVTPSNSDGYSGINLDGGHTLVPAMCPNCNAHMRIDTSSKIAHCDSCGTECFVQDAIKTLTVKGNVQVGSATINVTGTNTESLLQRVEILLADGDFYEVMQKCDVILDSEPANAKAYYYMLLASLHCRNRTDLSNQQISFEGNKYYIKAIQYGDDILKSELAECISIINNRNEATLKRRIAEQKAKRELIAEQKAKKETEINTLKTGDELYFGMFGGHPILWKSLNVRDNVALLICKNPICNMHYHDVLTGITWKDCSLRKWLNTDFYYNCFAQVEKNRIIPSELITQIKKAGLFFDKTSKGDQTVDNVFILSAIEAEQLEFFDKNRNCWLRSSGSSPLFGSYIGLTGTTFSNGNITDCKGVLPVIRIKTN